LAEKNEKAAFDKLKRSLEIFSDYFLALDRLGNEYVVRGHYEAAYVLLTKALVVNKRSHSSTMGLGLALFRLRQIDLAIGHFRSAVELEPASANGHLWLGTALHSKKKNSEALQSLIKADDLNKGASAEVHWQLARVYKDLNRFDKSADELELFLKFDPEAKNAAEVRQAIEALRKKK
jgi:tetratricopeptide (TPR) repeat protein